MKKIICLLFTFLVAFMFCTAPGHIVVHARETSGSDGIPYETMTLGTNNRLVYTQTAYIPYGILNQEDLLLSSPKDMYYYDQLLYVADTGNKRIVVLDEKGQLTSEIKNERFVEPTGIFVNEEHIYIADRGAKAVFMLDETGNLQSVYERPKEILFGKNTPYVPSKICVASSGLMYIVGEGSTNGVITINQYGEFMGYIGINSTTFSLRKYLYNFFVNNASLANQKPSAPTNLTIGANGNIFTTNINIAETFKRLNISGTNTLASDTYYPTEEISDISISDDNYIYISTVTGQIYEYDFNGKLLFKFDTKDKGNLNVLGLTNRIDSIETDQYGNIFVLDGTNNNIQMYQRTSFVNLLHQAVDMYNDGKYLQSKDLWESVLKQNNNFALAHTALGWSYFKEENNEAALNEFYLSKNYSGYSAVFWEIRNDFLQENTGWLILALVLLIVLYKVIKTILYANAIVRSDGKKIPLFIHKMQESFQQKEHHRFTMKFVTLLTEVRYSKLMLRKPADACYGVKKQKKASYWSAIVILILFVITYLLKMYATSFLFRSHGSFSNAISQLLIVFAVFMLWCIVNYLVATLNDGEGWFRDIFITTSYSLLPFIIIQLPLVPITYCLTYNESFIFSIANFITYAWCIILLLNSLLNIHNYSFKATLKNVIVTILGMLLIALTILLVYMFMAQLLDFLGSIIKEVFSRV